MLTESKEYVPKVPLEVLEPNNIYSRLKRISGPSQREPIKFAKIRQIMNKIKLNGLLEP